MSGLAGATTGREEIAGLHHDLLRFARLQLRDDALAEDVTQEAVTAALGAYAQFAGQSSLKTWVFSILRNKIIDAMRSRGRSINASALAPEDAAMDEAFEVLFQASGHWAPQSRPQAWANPEAVLSERQFWEVFDACLEHLPEATARVFMMREFLDFETQDICSELNITVNNCHVILHRARNGLRRCLQGSWFAGEAVPC